VVAVKKMLQGLNMALLRIADVLKRAYRDPKSFQYLGIGGPGVILVVRASCSACAISASVMKSSHGRRTGRARRGGCCR